MNKAIEKMYCLGCNKKMLKYIKMNDIDWFICENPFCLRYKLLSISYNSFKQKQLAEVGINDRDKFK